MIVKENVLYKIDKFFQDNNCKYFLYKKHNGLGTEIRKQVGPFGLFDKMVGSIFNKEIYCYENELFDLLRNALDLDDSVALLRR